MRWARLSVLVAVVVMVVMGTASSLAAPAATGGQRAAEILADERRELATATRPQLLRRLRSTDAQFHRLLRRMSLCRLFQAERDAIFRIRDRAMTRASRASVRSLRLRNALMSQGLVRLSRVAQRCAVASTPSVPPLPAPAPELVPSPGPGPAPGPLPIPIPTNPSPETTLRAGISLQNVVNGDTLDVSQTLGASTLPGSLPLSDLSELGNSACTRRGAVCLGVDRALLSAKLRELMNANLLVLLLRNIASVHVSSILTQITSLISAGDLSSLIAVQRVGDRALRLVPIGPLAQLTGLPEVPVAEVAQLQVVR